jgi:hypothetical protein
MNVPRRTLPNFRILAATCVAGAAVVTTGATWGRAYPLDGYEYTGIRRLRAYSMLLDGTMRGNLRLAAGARLRRGDIRLRLVDVNPEYDITRDTPRDSVLQAGLERIFRTRDESYRVALVDITDPLHPRYAAVRPEQGYLPGSVGKLMVMTGFFTELAKRFPGDVDARAALLRNTWIVADDFVIPNSHAVPVVNDDWSGVVHRAIRVGDRFTLWEWIDHMVSPSSNAAGSMVWKEAMFLRMLASAYPPSDEQRRTLFASTPRAELGEIASSITDEPLVALGLDTSQIKQRTMFTNTAQRVVPGGGSYSTPLQLVRWLVKLEQGQIVDRWSSLEMKRLLYFTRRRYRYAASSALENAAVYFKSGSLYQCQPEEGYRCVQYMGNKTNLMHSVAVVEMPATGDNKDRIYLVSMMSNVLRVNSASEHAALAGAIDRLVQSVHQ